MKPFIVFTLPYSRDAWIAAFLSYKGVVCTYNPSLDIARMEQVYWLLDQPDHGIVDNSLALVWPDIVDYAPHARIVTVRRPETEVLADMVAHGIGASEQFVRRVNCALDEVETLSNVLRVEFSDLGREATAKALFEFCLPCPFDRQWWLAGKDVLLEVSAESMLAKLSANTIGYRNIFASAARYYDKRLAERQA